MILRRFAGCVALTAVLLPVSAAFAGPYVSPNGFQMTAPAGWRTDKSGQRGPEVFFFAPPQNKFSANINVAIKAVPAGLTIAMLRPQLNATYPRIFAGYHQIAQRVSTLNGAPTLDTAATFQIGTPPRRLRSHQVFALHGRRAYIFTTTALDANHALYEPAFAGILKSVRWRK